MMKNGRNNSKQALLGLAIVLVVSFVIASFANNKLYAASDPIKDRGLSIIIRD